MTMLETIIREFPVSDFSKESILEKHQENLLYLNIELKKIIFIINKRYKHESKNI